MPAILRITPNGSGPRGTWTNVWDCLTVSDAYGDAESAVDFIANAYKDYWATSVGSAVSINGFKVLALGTGLPTVDIMPTVGPIFGTQGASELLPAQVALLLRFASVSERPNRARKYFPGLAEIAWTGGAWGATTIEAFNLFGAEMVEMETLTAEGIQFGVSRTPTGGGAILFTQMTQFAVDPYAVTQRRRR